MNFEHLFAGQNLALIRQLTEVVEQGEEGPVFTGRSPDIHPIDRTSLVNQWRKWLKECGLRKQELPAVEYVQWLRKEREACIKGMVDSPEKSPSHLYFEQILPIVREEIRQAEGAKTQLSSGESLRKQVLELVKKGQLEVALELVCDFVDAHKDLHHYQDEMIHLQSELAHQNDSERKGLLPLEYSRRARNQLLHALLGILDDIDQPATQ